jgi:hypothetical protein
MIYKECAQVKDFHMFQRLEATVYRTEDYSGKPMLSIHFGPDQCILISETYGISGFGEYSGAGPTVRRLCDILEWHNMGADGEPHRWVDYFSPDGIQSRVLDLEWLQASANHVAAAT